MRQRSLCRGGKHESLHQVRKWLACRSYQYRLNDRLIAASVSRLWPWGQRVGVGGDAPRLVVCKGSSSPIVFYDGACFAVVEDDDQFSAPLLFLRVEATMESMSTCVSAP